MDVDHTVGVAKEDVCIHIRINWKGNERFNASARRRKERSSNANCAAWPYVVPVRFFNYFPTLASLYI